MIYIHVLLRWCLLINIVMLFITSDGLSFPRMEITELQSFNPSRRDLDPFMMSYVVMTAVRMLCEMRSDPMREGKEAFEGIFEEALWAVDAWLTC